jgi:hypothetical protein
MLLSEEDIKRALGHMEPSPSASKDEQAERRAVAVTMAVRMVLDGRLPPWEAFDYAHGLLQFLNTGTPFRFDKGTLGLDVDT